MAETSLHVALKNLYSHPGDQLEAAVDGYLIDLVRGDLLIEIQTGNFTSLKPKLHRLLPHHKVRLVHPIPVEKWILRYQSLKSKTPTRRKSPKRGRIDHLFTELIRFPELVPDPNLSIEVLFTREEEWLLNDQKGSWRRKGWSIYDRRLIEVTGSIILESPHDFRHLLPEALPNPFSTSDLAVQRSIPRKLAGRMAYCLRKMGVISACGKRARETLYMVNERAENAP